MTLQVHLRHLVGGRARSFTGELPDERIFQVRSGPSRHSLLNETIFAGAAQTLLGCNDMRPGRHGGMV